MPGSPGVRRLTVHGANNNGAEQPRHASFVADRDRLPQRGAGDHLPHSHPLHHAGGTTPALGTTAQKRPRYALDLSLIPIITITPITHDDILYPSWLGKLPKIDHGGGSCLL